MRFVRLASATVVIVAVIGGYSGGASGERGSPASGARADVAGTPRRPTGPAADLSQEITGGNGPVIGESSTPDLKRVGYVQHEYVAAGTASSYTPVGSLTPDGRWTLSPASKASYRTRIVVRRPANAARFSGTVVVEWNNVSGGIDADPEFTSLEAELLRGDVWVGVSTQVIGVEGGPVLVPAPGAEGIAGKGLKALDPTRYGSLDHPGDGYSFDMFTQVARALRRGGPAIGGMRPQRVLAAGESQSAIALTTYYNGFQPLTRAFDGFLVHSRASVSLPLVAPGRYADLAGSISAAAPAIFRTDLDTPVLELQTEADVTGVLKSIEVRQADSDHFRLWEVAGTAHADVHLVGRTISDTLDVECRTPINDGPMHVVADAAFRGLDTWVRTGAAPPKAPRLEVTPGNQPEVRRDADGIALGGIRTAPVDVPVDVLSGVPGSSSNLICLLLGSTRPLPMARLARLYPSRRAYQEQYAASITKSIKAGFVLEQDRRALLAFAKPSRIAG